MKWELRPLKLTLKVNWKLSRNEAFTKENFLLILHDELGDFCAEIAPNIRYGQNRESVERDFQKIQKSGVSDLAQFHKIKEQILLADSTWCAFEWCLLQKELSIQKTSLAKYLGIKEAKSIATAISLPIMDIKRIGEYLEDKKHFKYLKVKVSEENAYAMLSEVAQHTKQPLMVDANEGWSSTFHFLNFCSKAQKFNIEFIEQPFAANRIDLYRELKGKSPYKIMADESCVYESDIAELSELFDIINIKLMKSRGVLHGMHQLKQVRSYGLLSMLGCMIESSLGINPAWQIAGEFDYVDLDGALLLENDPFDFLEEKDGMLVRPKRA